MSYSSAPNGPKLHHSPKHVSASIADAQRSQEKHSTPVVTESQTPRPTADSTVLPSLATLTGPTEASTGSPTAWRSGGLQSILNPSEPRSVRGPDARLSQSSAPFASPRGRKRGESRSPGVDSNAPSSVRLGRRILTPRSPAIRAASLGAHRSPSIGSSLDSRQPLHGPEGRHYTAEPGTHSDAAVPPMPSLPVTRGILPTIQTADHEIRDQRRVSISTATPLTSNSTQPLFMGHNSIGSTGGPSSAYAQQRPPSPTYHPSQQHLVSHNHPLGADGTPPYSTLQGPGMGQGLPRVQSGWKMALETGQGREVVEVDIDYRQASKMADEKRKRNAGASARFRARRKEKEKESSQMISGLQQELHEMTEERDHYRNERNYYRDLFARNNSAPLPARPQSPGLRHGLSMSINSMDSSASRSYDPREGPELNVQRRRTSDYQPTFTASPSTTTYNPSYATPGPAYNQPVSVPPVPYQGEHRSQSHPPGHHAPPPPLSMTPAHPQEMDPFRRDLMDRWHPPKP